jgi:peptidyl-prolyl cis-trans isomerase SDCCAG10
MSAIYNLEPQPTASAILHTTLGEISVELFAKQTPLTCRNFLQLALDGYYDNTDFHRLVPGFILQGGDPTGTGNGGESIYDGGAFSGELDPWPMDERRGRNAGPQGINFKDEFHSRLKFNRRGLLAMANEGKPDTNGSQFFFTLDKADELNGKNTLFGRVAGDTIYNLMKIGESEVAEGTERLLYPVKIQKVEILVNPFEDMVKRSRVATQAPSKIGAGTKDKKKKRKGGKNMLSFGDEEGVGDEDLPILKKAKFDTRLIAEDEEPEKEEEPKTKSKAKTKAKKTQESPPKAQPEPVDSEDGQDHDRIAVQPRKERKTQPIDDGPLSPEPAPPSPKKKSALEKANEEIAALKASMRRNIHTEKPVEEKKKSALETMIPETSVKGGRKRGRAGNTVDDPKTLRMLQSFQSRLQKAPIEKEAEPAAAAGNGGGDGQGGADEEAELCDLHFIANCQSCTSWDKQGKDDSDDEGWMSHTLSFAADRLGKDLTNRKKAEEELVVIDPREKARALKEGKRTDRDAKGSGKAWDQRRDQARNAKLAQAASLAGRGAK